METSDLIELWCKLIQESGYRLTLPRKAIVEIMATSERALGPLAVYDRGRREHDGLGLVTVYRTLEKLEELHLIQRVHQPDGCHRYLRAGTGHQHILLCTDCGLSMFFRGDDISELLVDLTESSGFEISDHWLQLFGLCPACRNEKRNENLEVT